MFDPKKRAFFVRLLGEEATASLEAGLLAQGKRLMATPGVNWKSLDACLGAACPPAAPAPASAPALEPASPASPYVAQLHTPPPAPAGVAAAQAALNASGNPAAQYVLQLFGE